MSTELIRSVSERYKQEFVPYIIATKLLKGIFNHTVNLSTHSTVYWLVIAIPG